MPEAAMNQYRAPVAPEHDVGLAGEFAVMEAEAEPHGVGGTAHDHLRPRVTRFYSPHDRTADFARYAIHHRRLIADRLCRNQLALAVLEFVRADAQNDGDESANEA